MSKPSIKFIAAIDNERGMGRSGAIPWKLPGDVANFRRHTLHQTIVMGQGTFKSLHSKPMPDRTNIVVSRTPLETAGIETIQDIPKFVANLQKDIWVIGGGQIFAEFLPYATELHLTRVSGTFDCDVFFPEFEDRFKRIWQSETYAQNGISYHYEIWKPKH